MPGDEQKQRNRAGTGRPAFVVQKHRSRTLHYDFRLEVAGVLKSWAVPKGIPADPSQKHLAVPTDDHPLGYGTFEGVIPEGEYGAGTVMVWDTGTYENIRAGKDGTTMEEALGEGKVEVRLQGTKLRGDYALIRTGKPAAKRWLLIKMRDAEVDPGRVPAGSEARSALSGRTMAEIERDTAP